MALPAGQGPLARSSFQPELAFSIPTAPQLPGSTSQRSPDVNETLTQQLCCTRVPVLNKEKKPISLPLEQCRRWIGFSLSHFCTNCSRLAVSFPESWLSARCSHSGSRQKKSKKVLEEAICKYIPISHIHFK